MVNPWAVLSSLVPVRSAVTGLQVCNRGFPPVPREVGDEMKAWGGSIAREHLVRAAGGWIPGAAQVHTAYQLYRSLTEVQRGNLLHALRQVPVTAVLPAAALALLRQALQSLLPRALQNAPDHESLVLALAVGVWLCDSSDSADRSRSEPFAQRAVGLLRALRTGLDTLRGVRNIMALPFPLDDVPALEWSGAPGRAPAQAAPARNTTEMSRPVPANPRARVQALLSTLGDVLAETRASAWPFPGASAASRGRAKGAHHPPKPAPAPKPGAGSTSGRRTSGTLTLSTSSGARRRLAGGASRPPGGSHGAARNPTAMSGNAGSSKQSMPSLTSNTAGEKAQSRAAAGVNAAEGTTAGRPSKGLDMGRSSVFLQIADPGFEESSSSSEEVAEPIVPLFSPVCVRPDGEEAVKAQLEKARCWSTPTRFCIAEDAADQFERHEAFTKVCAGKRDHWFVTEPLREEVPAALRKLHMERSKGLRALAGNRPERLGPLGTDAVFSPVSISLWRPETPAAHPPAYLPHLERNTFRLMHYTGLGGTQQQWIAYFINQQHEDGGGVRAGFLRVYNDIPGQVSVEDTLHMRTVSARTLETLVEGLESITGMRYLPPTGAQRTGHELSANAVASEPLANLLVTQEETLSWKPPHDYLECDAQAEVFAPVRVRVEGRPTPFMLYRNSFIMTDDHLAYADNDGNGGALWFGPHVGRHGRRKLHGRTQGDTAFAQQHGLRLGAVYSPAHVAEKLKEADLLQLPETEQLTDRKEAVPAEDGQAPPAPAQFRFLDGTLTYTNAAGQGGVVRFSSVPTPEGVRYALEAGQSTVAITKGRPALVERELYSESDIIWILYSEGFTGEGLSHEVVSVRPAAGNPRAADPLPPAGLPASRH